MSKKGINIVYLVLYSLLGIAGVMTLLWEKSEVSELSLLGYSWQRIGMAVVAILFIAAILVLTYRWYWASDSRYPQLSRLKSKFLNDSALQRIVFWLVITIDTLVILAILYIFQIPNDGRIPYLRRAFGLILTFEGATLLLASRILGLQFDEIKKGGFRGFVRFAFYEIGFVGVGYLLFFRFADKAIELINPYVKGMIWVLIIVSGMVVYEILFVEAAKKRTHRIWETDWKYYLLYFLIIGIILSLGHVAFGVNDDFYIMQIAAGWIDGIPDPHLVYTNVIIGWGLSSLYQIAPNVQWYVYYLLVTLVFSGLIILNVVLFYARNNKAFAAILFGITFFPFVFRFTYTSISILASLAGFAYLFKIHDQENGKKFARSVLPILLVVFGGLIRLNGMFLAGLLLVPLLGYRVFYRKQTSILYPLILLIVLIGATVCVDRLAYDRVSEWKAYQAYNSQRGKIHGTPRLSLNRVGETFWDEIGWKISGYGMFEGWVFFDTDVFTVDSFEKINKSYPILVNDLNTVTEMFTSALRNYKAEVFLLLFLLSKALIQRGERIGIKLACLSSGFALLVYVILLFFVRAPLFVVEPMIFYIDLVLGVALLQDRKVDGLRLGSAQVSFSVVLMLFLVAQLIVLTETNTANNNDAEGFTRMVSTIEKSLETESAPLVLFEGGDVPVERIPIFTAKNFSFHALPIGWLTQSPPYNHLLSQYGIENPVVDIIDRPDVYLIGTQEGVITNYLKEVKGIDAKSSLVAEIPVALYYFDHIDLVRIESAD